MRLSIIAPVLNSHEIVRRQLLHFDRIGLPEDTELILVDDGSDPPLWVEHGVGVDLIKPNFQFLSTGDTRPWTWALARNMAARKARGEYLLMFDIDHIVTRKLLDFVLTNDAPRIHFPRRFGVLDEEGVLVRDRAVLETYGLPPEKKIVESHQNSFAMRKSLFWELGGYREDLIGKPYPQGEDSDFYHKWQDYGDREGIKSLEGPVLYVFPSGRWCGDVDYNPHGLFHDLSRKSEQNYYWRKQCKDSPETCR